ncbi:hypothetical protein JYU34_010505 [Plutella xylostella]|uniref:Uncharacterized protein n=1 Tax=Plutella xylostella TaxID=51655 RepID=A0ABQ7QIP7_PLUXY|nr:hypothetical protein JYU34_010505 [Plutella xylostella]
MAVELQSFQDNQAWEVVDTPSNASVVHCKWAFKKKFDSDNKGECSFLSFTVQLVQNSVKGNQGTLDAVQSARADDCTEGNHRPPMCTRLS